MSSASVLPPPVPSLKNRAVKLGIGLLLAAVVWTVLLGWWLPRWAKGQVEAVASQTLGIPVTLAELTVQPWTLTVGLKGLTVGTPKAELLQVPEAQVQLSLESIWRLTPVVRRVTLERPQLWIERQSAERFNFTDIARRLQSPPSQPSAEPARFAVYNIRVHQGLVRYSDRVLQQEHRVEALNIGVPFISNLPSFISVEVQPLLEARVDGSALRMSGRSLPFSEGLRSTVDLNWRGVDLAQWLRAARPFMPPDLAIDLASGRLDTQLTVNFEERKPPAVATLQIKGGLKVSSLEAAWPARGVQGRWSALDVEGIDAMPLVRKVSVGSVTLSGLALDANARVFTTKKTGVVLAPIRASQPDASRPGVPWAWSVGKVRLAASSLQAETPEGVALPKLGPLTLNMEGLNAHPKAAPATLALTVLDEHGGQLHVQGVVTPMLPLATLKVSASQLQSAPWLAALARSLPWPWRVMSGELSLSTELNYGNDQLGLSNGQLQLTGLKTKASKATALDHVDLARLDVQGVEAAVNLSSANSGLQSLSLATVTLDQLDVQATRDAQGHWVMQPMPSPAAASGAADQAASPSPSSSLPALKLGELRCKACQFQIDDQAVSPAARLSLRQTDLALENISSDLSQTVGFDLNGLGQGQGRLRLAGEVRLQPLMLRSQWAVQGLDLRGAQPYVAPYLNVTLAGAKASINGKLSLDALPGKTSVQDPKAVNVRYVGRLALTDLRTQDSVNQADFLRWRSLSLDGLDVNWQAGALTADLGRIALDDFYGRLIINPSGKLNLGELVKHDAGSESQSLTTPQAQPQPATPPIAIAAAPGSAASAVAAPASAMAGMNLRWQGIKLGKGRVDFTDNFIKPNYSARLTQVEGDVSAVASSKPEPATVRISGQVDDSAPLLITGQLHPLGPRFYTDIQGSAKGIELTRLTPYAGRYAGYAIEKGTLSVTVHYQVDQGKLEAQNQIFLDQLTFGDKVDSPDATSLPVQFAVSLLKNNRGEIDVSLPVSGSLDDPEFSVGGIVWRVIANLVSKAVTAPFSLLMGPGQDELGFVPFEPGDDDLSEAARQRLDTLVAKLSDRPQLKLEATGRADPALDEEGLRQRHVVRLMRQAKAKATEQAFASTVIAPEERGSWLTAAYKAADIKKPRNLVGLAKTLPPAEMEALLKAAAPVDSGSLLTLANRRGDRVKAYLVSKLSPERVLLTASKVGTDPLPDDQGPTTRVQFALK